MAWKNIWTAASDGEAARVFELIDSGECTPISPDENGYTPIHAAASWGHAELLRDLLDRCPEGINVADSDGDTALHHVAGAEELGDRVDAILQLLLQRSGDLAIKNAEGKTPLDVAQEAGHHRFAEVIEAESTSKA